MESEADTQNWRETARRARALLSDSVDHGHKSARLVEVADALRVTRGTLDNYLGALAAFERLKGLAPDIAAKLDGQSAAAMAALGRWAGYDLPGLGRFISDHANPRLRQVLEAERVARLSQGRVPISTFDAVIEKSRAIPIRGQEDLWSRPGGDVAAALGRLDLHDMPLLDLDWAGALPEYAGAIGLTRLGRLHEKDERNRARVRNRLWGGANEADVPVAGLIEVPYRAREEQYRRQARGLWLRMVAAATLVPVVILLLPDAAARKASLGNFPSPPAAWSRKGQGRPNPWTRPLNSVGGLALLTTLETLFADWADKGPESRNF